MPLTRFINGKLDRLRELLADPQVVAIDLGARPEVKVMATKLLVAAADGDDDVDLLVGVTATFQDADTLCAEIAHTAAEEVGHAQEALDGEQTAFVVPRAVNEDRGVGIEVRLVEYLEGISRAYANHTRQWVVALDVTVPAEHEAAWAHCLTQLLTSTGPGRIKWVIFNDETPALGAQVLPRWRWQALPRPSGGQLDAALRELVTDPRRRLLTVDGRRMAATSVAERLRRQPCASVRTAVAVVVPPLPFVSPLYHWVEAGRAVARRCHALEQQATGGPHTRPLLDEAEELAAYHDAETAFVDLCARLAAAMLRERGQLVVIISAPTDGDPQQLQASLARLAAATICTRVEMVVLLPDALPAVEPAPPRVEPFVFDLDAQQIEKGLAQRLEADDLSDLERLRYTSAAAGWALAKGEPDQAMLRSLDALEQSRRMDDPREQVVAWYGLGNTLYQCMTYADAADAYTTCVEQALDVGHSLMAAQGLMGLGNTWLMRDDPSQAAECYDSAQALFAKLGLPHFEAHALTWRAEATLQLGERGPAREYFDRAIAACDGMDPMYASTTASTKADVLQRMARMYRDAGLHAQAQDHQREADALGATAAPCHHP